MKAIFANLALILLFSLSFSALWAEEPDFFSRNLFFTEGMLTKRPAPDDSAVLAKKTPAKEENMPAEESGNSAIIPEFITSEEPGEDIAFSQEQTGDNYNDLDLLFFEASGLIYEVTPPVIEPRSFNDIFPHLSRSQRRNAGSESGLRHAFEKNESPLFLPTQDSGIDLISFVLSKKPSHIVEALILVPYKKRELDMLDAYNAMREIGGIKDQTLTIRNNQYKVFKETTRLESAKNRKPIPDPGPADSLPYSETMYLRFTDATIGELYIQGEIKPGLYGITYSMTNFRDVNYSIFRVMKAEKFTAIIYIEPVKEGILIYSMSGLYLPGFIASRMNLPSNMNYRITVLLNWIIHGLRTQENTREKAIPFAVK
ncbi:MAG: hypothetical protein FWB83_10800 [Treponema sp.]|nr:hypothetical protein [Treponema sp.]